jgi:hypothetical protein
MGRSVIPAEAGIQRVGAGSRVKPGMTFLDPGPGFMHSGMTVLRRSDGLKHVVNQKAFCQSQGRAASAPKKSARWKTAQYR